MTTILTMMVVGPSLFDMGARVGRRRTRQLKIATFKLAGHVSHTYHQKFSARDGIQCVNKLCWCHSVVQVESQDLAATAYRCPNCLCIWR